MNRKSMAGGWSPKRERELPSLDRLFATALALASLATCSHPEPARSPARLPADPPLFTAVEGRCSTLTLAPLANRTIIVHGRSADPPKEAAQTFTEIVGHDMRSPVDLLSGLPVDSQGYVPEELELSGRWPNATHLRNTRIEHFTPGGAVDFISVESAKRWSGGWIDEQRTAAWDAACSGDGLKGCFRELGSRELGASQAIVVGTCGNCTTKAPRPPRLVALHRVGATWEVRSLPDASALGESCTHASLTISSPSEAYVSAAGDDSRSIAYIARFDGRVWSRIDTPYGGPATDVSGRVSEALWVTAGGVLWSKRATSTWKRVELPGPVLPRAPRGLFRAIGVQAVAGDDLWIEAALDRDPSYRTLLRTRDPGFILRCDEDAAATIGLARIP
jgi:hypothetical protein